MRIVPDNVLLNKAAIMERGIRRMQEEYNADSTLQNYTHLDALTLNIERVCQAAIDAALHLVAIHHLGMPQNSADAFIALEKAGIISSTSTKAMIAMTGFRNVAIHEYQSLNLDVVHAIVQTEYASVIQFCEELGMSIRP